MKGLSVLFGVLLFVVICQALQMRPRIDARKVPQPSLGRSNARLVEEYARSDDANPHISLAAKFDFYMIVLQWDPKVTTSYFTIHGLWPENSDGTYPENCAGPKFNTTVISDLVTTLNKVWPSNNGANTNFWTHEWEKHGTCSEFGERAYFQNSINLQSSYDIKGALAKSSIVPSNSKTYTSASVKTAVLNNIGANPALHCTSSKLVEVALCVAKTTLKLTNCPNSLGSYFSCPASVTFSA